MQYFLIFVVKEIYKIISKISWSLTTTIKINDMYHTFIFNRLRKYFNKAMCQTRKHHKQIGLNSNIIWMFWWQGPHHMPMIVNRCIQSIYKYSNGHRVILVDKNNINKYATIPRYIFYKMSHGNISLTHFSDILRFNLLSNYGGLWIDSTIFCSSNITSDFSNFYTSGGYNNVTHQFISAKWTGFLIGGCKNNKIFRFMSNFFDIYWKYNNKLIDYFLIDYALYYVYMNNISNFKNYVNHKAFYNNPHLYSLVNLLDESFNKNLYNKITYDTNLFKLTYKQNFNSKKNTFYYYLINNKIPN